MTKQQLIKKLAHQEFIHDQLTMELSYVNHLLKQVGFPNGLESAKAVAEELLFENTEVFMDENQDKLIDL